MQIAFPSVECSKYKSLVDPRFSFKDLSKEHFCKSAKVVKTKKKGFESDMAKLFQITCFNYYDNNENSRSKLNHKILSHG